MSSSNKVVKKLDEKVLQKTKELFRFFKKSFKNSKGEAETDFSSNSGQKDKNNQNIQFVIHEEDFQLKIDNECHSDILEEIEKILSISTEQRDIIISDKLYADISFMFVRMADFIKSTLNEREQIAKERELFEELKKEKDNLQSIVDGYNEQMKKKDQQNEKEKEQMLIKYTQEFEALNKQIEILISEKNVQKKQIDEQIVSLINSGEKINQLQAHNKSIQNSLDILNIDMVNLKAIHQGEVQNAIHERSFKSLLTSKNTKHRILSFLPFKEILKMRLINREYNLIITRDFQLQRILIGHISESYNAKTRELYRRANFFQQIAERLPEEVLKVSILKYLCQRHKVGDLLVPALNSAQIIIDGLLFPNEHESTSANSTKSSLPQSSQSISLNNSQQQQQNEGIDLLSEYLSGELDSSTPQNQQINQNDQNNSQKVLSDTTPKEKQSKTQKTLSFMKNIFKKEQIDNSQQKGQQVTAASRNILEKTLQNDHMSEDQANKLISDMNSKLQIDQNILNLFLEEKEVTMKQLKFEQDEIHQKIKTQTLKYSQDPKKITVFLETLENSFCNLYVFSKFLYQECKALYDLQSYLSFELISNKTKLEDAQNKLEDQIASIRSFEQMKDYLSIKLKETEKKNLQSDTIFLKNNKLIQELKSENNQLQNQLTQSEKQKTKSDSNLKILAKEVRNQLKKNQEIDQRYKKLLANMNYLKDALTNFKILED